MRILFVAGNPELERRLDLDKEISALQREIDDAPVSEPIEFKVYSNCRIDELPGLIAKLVPDVIHISAHGVEDSIVLKDADERSVKLSGDRLAAILDALGIRPALVVINACSSEAMARDLAHAADFVIGTNAPIGNAAARVMAATLYQRLARGASLHAAFVAAREMLGATSAGGINTILFPEGAEEQARRRVLVEPFRIVARLPTIDKALREGRNAPEDFDAEEVLVSFGVAGAPQGSTQLVLFTDDEDVAGPEGMSEEELRSWIVTRRPVNGELWTKPPYYYYGDMQWYAAVVTSGRRIVGAESTTSAALERYYFDEEWRGDLPPESETLVRRVLQALGERNGSRRHRTPRSRVPDKSRSK